jgi:transcription elongation factor Elf1
MTRRADNEEPELDCPHCGRSFHSFARLDDHMSEHEGLKHCNGCGATIRGPYHRCR